MSIEDLFDLVFDREAEYKYSGCSLFNGVIIVHILKVNFKHFFESQVIGKSL
jgi:hypothetical protein